MDNVENHNTVKPVLNGPFIKRNFILNGNIFRSPDYHSITLIKRKPGFSGKMFWTLEIPFKTGFTVFVLMYRRHTNIWMDLTFGTYFWHELLLGARGSVVGWGTMLQAEGRAIAQAVSRWLPIAAARVQTGSSHVGFVVDKVALRQVFSKYFGFPC
jgi:hypothetical protein